MDIQWCHDHGLPIGKAMVNTIEHYIYYNKNNYTLSFFDQQGYVSRILKETHTGHTFSQHFLSQGKKNLYVLYLVLGTFFLLSVFSLFV